MISHTVSIGNLHKAFRAAGAPELEHLVGQHEAQYAGPLWMRASGAPTMTLTGMPKWYGKRFRAPESDESTLEGVNLLRTRDGLEMSLPMRAELAPSRVDGLPALIVSYPSDARWPWRGVNDELRPIGEETLLGLTFGLMPGFFGGVPFMLHRRVEA